MGFPDNFMGFPKMRGTILVVPITRMILFWSLYWGSADAEKLPYLFGGVGTGCLELLASFLFFSTILGIGSRVKGLGAN